MRLLLLPVFLLFVLTTAADARIMLQHPDDSRAEIIGTFQVGTTVAPAMRSRSSRDLSGFDANEGCRVTADVVVWRRSLGGIDLGIDASSVRAHGSGAAIDGIRTAELFARLSREAVTQAFILDYLHCPISFTAPGLSRLYIASTVARSGSGEATRFLPCGLAGAYREYSYYQMNGVRLVTDLPVPQVYASGAYESTVENAAGEIH